MNGDGDIIDVVLWRRGRGLRTWRFCYFDHGFNPYLEVEDWYTSPGWYAHARKYTYRLTIDHDYPDKPVWLGYRHASSGEWRNAEGLYEVLGVDTPGHVVVNGLERRGRKGGRRIRRSKQYVSAVAQRITSRVGSR